ncbi:uncharacterized protein PG986_002145 [Apiospora aurea]|uniref:Uncharacterized protein n=1 Tax=Apiospora aurea TaxID=335848 RepID=A0ABR1QYX5_9PEZI
MGKKFPGQAYDEPFLKPSETNPEKQFEIGIARKKRHASVIIQDIKPDGPNSSRTYFEDAFKPNKNYSFDVPNYQILHIRFTEPGAGRTEQLVALGLDTPDKRRDVDQYDRLYRIRTTDRMLKYIALISCPAHHAVMTSDCATFAHNFLTELLDRLLKEGHMDKEKYRQIIKSLVKHVRAANGPLGQTETVSRQQEDLAKSGGSAIQRYSLY